MSNNGKELKTAKNIVIAISGAIVRVAIVLLCGVIIKKYAVKAYDFGFRIFAEQPVSSEGEGRNITITVNSSDSQSDIIQMLEDKGLIRDANIFKVQKKLSLYKADIKPGTYELNTSMTTDEMLEILVGEIEESEEETEPDELKEELNPQTDDITGLESGGVLSEEGDYDESEAFEEEGTDSSDEYIGEGDEESAIEE